MKTIPSASGRLRCESLFLRCMSSQGRCTPAPSASACKHHLRACHGRPARKLARGSELLHYEVWSIDAVTASACVYLVVSLQRSTARKYLKNNFFEKEYEVDHISGWQVLWFSGEFNTRLRVTERKRSGQVHFKLLSSDVMEDFDGEWTLKPCTQQALDKMYGKSAFNPFGGLQSANS